MRGEHARCSARPMVVGAHRSADDGFDGFGGDAARSQDGRRVDGQVDDGGLDADARRAAVEHQVDIVAEVLPHVLSGRGAHPTEPVGRGSGDATSEGRQQLEGQRMGRHPQPDGVAPAGHGRVDARSAVEQEGQRSRPAGVPERCGRGRDVRRPLRQRGGRRDVDDQRVVDRPALHGIEPAHRVRVGGVGAQAVHGLGRKGHQPTGSQDRHRFAHLRRRHGASGRYGVEEPQHGVEERERLRGGEVVGVAERDEARIG